MTTTTRPRHTGPPLGPLAAISAGLFIAAIVLGVALTGELRARTAAPASTAMALS